MKISYEDNRIDINVHINKFKTYTQIYIIGFLDYMMFADSFRVKISPRRFKKNFKQYIYWHCTNNELRKALLGKL